MNTNAPTDQALLRANLLGFVTQVKAAAEVAGKPLADAEVIGMHKRATAFIQGVMTKRAKIAEVIRAGIPKPATA